MMKSAIASVLVLVAAAGAFPGQQEPGKNKAVRKDSLGDPLPDDALLRIGTARLQHWGSVRSLAISEDGQLVASCGGEQIVRVSETKGGKPLWEFKLSHWGPWALAFSRDGKELTAISRSKPGTKAGGDIRRWDVATGRLLEGDKDSKREWDSQVIHVALVRLAGGDHVAAETDDSKITVYRPGVPNSAKTFESHKGRVMSVDFTRDGKTLVSMGDDGFIRFWNVGNAKQIAKVHVPPMNEKHSLKGNLATVAIAPDATYLAVSLPDGTTRLLDDWGKELRRLACPQQLYAMAFSPDGKVLFVGDGMVQAWKVADGTEAPLLTEFPKGITALAMAPDGKTIAVRDEKNNIRLVDIATGKTLSQGKTASKCGIAFSPDGKRLAVAGGDRNIALWDVAKLRAANKPFAGEPDAVLLCHQRVVAFVFSPDGKRLATAQDGCGCGIYDVATNKPLLMFKPPGSAVFGVAFSPDGQLLATMGEGGHFLTDPVDGEALLGTSQVVRVWDSFTGKERAIAREILLTAHTVAFHSSGKSLMALHLPAAAKTWPRSGYKVVNDIPLHDRMETIRLWDIAGVREKLRFEDPVHRAYMESMDTSTFGYIIGRSHTEPCVFSPDGRLFAVAGSDGVLLYETASGKPRIRLSGHVHSASAFAFTPDGKTLVSTSMDSTILIWDLTGLRTGDPLAGNAEELWGFLGDANPERAGKAVWAMVDASEQSLKVFRKYLRPVPSNKELLPKLIAELDDPKYAVREKAMRALAMLGPAAEQALVEQLRQKPSLEMTRRVETVLATIRSSPPTTEQLRVMRAVEVLEWMGTAEAREFLAELASGAEGAVLTSQANEALKRLGR